MGIAREDNRITETAAGKRAEKNVASRQARGRVEGGCALEMATRVRMETWRVQGWPAKPAGCARMLSGEKLMGGKRTLRAGRSASERPMCLHGVVWRDHGAAGGRRWETRRRSGRGIGHMNRLCALRFNKSPSPETLAPT